MRLPPLDPAAGPEVLTWLRVCGSELLLAAVDSVVEPRRLFGDSAPDGRYAILLSTGGARAETALQRRDARTARPAVERGRPAAAARPGS